MTKRKHLATAYHEAGHVVIAHGLGLPLGDGGVSIMADDESAGRTHIPYDPPIGPDELRLYVEKHVMTLLAGTEAQRKFNSRSVRGHHPHDDYKEAVELLGYINFLMAWTRQKLECKPVWAQIVGVAEALRRQERLTKSEVEAVSASAIKRKA